MAQALYRKYRSKSLDEIVGQEHITRTLSQAVKSGRIAHAYLFTGPKGVGKTSIARILAHDINGLPYSDDSAHIDIIEIDAASNRKLEETKALIEKVYVAPVSAKYKVYIIDEVHMLTPDSFNALLKTLEEPPEHVVFILATTDAHKLPETVISRTQRFQFKPIEAPKVMSHLSSIASKEKIAVDDAALALIAAHGQGSFRDSISLLDQAASYSQPVTAQTINALLGIPPTEQLEKVSAALSSGSSAALISVLHDLYEQGYPAPTVASRLSQLLRDQLVSGTNTIDNDTLLDLLSRLLEVPAAAAPQQLLEICLLRALPLQTTQDLPPKAELETSIEPAETVISDVKPPPSETKPTPKQETKPAPKSVSEQAKPKPRATATMDKANWDEVLNLLKTRYNTLYGIVRMGSPDFSEAGVVKLKFAFPFHQKRVNDAKNREIIHKAIAKVSGKDFALECVVDKELLSKPSKAAPELEAINNIFGGGEVLD